MKAMIYLLCVLLFCNACNLLKNTSSKAEHFDQSRSDQLELKNLLQKHAFERSMAIEQKHDSSSLIYSIELRPKGKFTFSKDQGFAGEAERIMIRGIAKSGSSKGTLNQQSKSNRENLKQELAQKQIDQSAYEVQEKGTALSWKWLLVSSLALIIIAWLIYRELKRIFTIKI